MKITYQHILFILSLFFVTSCEKSLSELNENKTSAVAIDPVFQLNNAIVNISFPSATTLNYEMAIVQQLVTPNSGVVSGGNYNQDNRDNTQVLWQNYYRNVIRNTRDVIVRTKA